MTQLKETKGRADEIDAFVGKRLKTRRIMLGLSQHDLGEAVNVSIQQIQKYEKATNRISSGKLWALAKLLMVPVEFFFKDIESSENANLADEKERFEIDNFNVSEKELLSLIRSYAEIKDNNVRKKVVDLVKTLSDATPSNTPAIISQDIL